MLCCLHLSPRVAFGVGSVMLLPGIFVEKHMVFFLIDVICWVCWPWFSANAGNARPRTAIMMVMHNFEDVMCSKSGLLSIFETSLKGVQDFSLSRHSERGDFFVKSNKQYYLHWKVLLVISCFFSWMNYCNVNCKCNFSINWWILKFLLECRLQLIKSHEMLKELLTQYPIDLMR